MAYDLGDVATLAVQIKDSTGTLANAGALAATITLPDGTTTTPTVSNPSTGPVCRYRCHRLPPKHCRARVCAQPNWVVMESGGLLRVRMLARSLTCLRFQIPRSGRSCL